jgi:hypothetical protein
VARAGSVALRAPPSLMKVRMKPHTGAQGIAAGLLLMAFTGTAESNTHWPLPLAAAIAFIYVGGLALASWGVWSWWSDHRPS